ncbi:hypothetical protein D3C85_1212790 [compost metagenome]
MDALSVVLLFVIFFLGCAVWFGVVNRSILPFSLYARGELRVACTMLVFVLAVLVLALIGLPSSAVLVGATLMAVAVVCFYRTVANKIEGVDKKQR